MSARLALIAACLAALACSRRDADAERATRATETPTAPRTIVFVVLDGVRPDHLGVYGAPRGDAPDAMPSLATLASDALVLEDAITASTGTNAALASLLTGLWPDRHGLGSLRELGQQRLRAGVDTLAERLASDGWRTIGVTALPQLGAELSGLAQGFETYVEAPVYGEADLTAQEVRHRALRALEPHLGGSERIFALVHFADARASTRPEPELAAPFLAARLSPLLAQRPDLAQLLELVDHDPAHALETLERTLGRSRGSPLHAAWQAALHDARLAAIDRELGVLFDWLDASGRLDGALLVVTGTRGEVYEPRTDAAAPFFPEALVRVPLLVAVPGISAGRIAATVRTVDVVPTVLEALGQSAEGLDGESLLALLANGAQDDRVALVWSASHERRAAFTSSHAREEALAGDDVLHQRRPAMRLVPATMDERARGAAERLGRALRERASAERWIVEHGGGEPVRVQWRFEAGFVRGVEIVGAQDATHDPATTAAEDAASSARTPRPAGPTRIDGSAELAGGALAVHGSRRSLALRLYFTRAGGPLDERAIHAGAQPLAQSFLPRVPSPVEEPWPLDDAGQPVAPLVDFQHRGDSWWQLDVGGEPDRAVRILLARFPPTRPGEELVANPALGEKRTVDGRLDAVWLEGETPFTVHVEKTPSEDLALAVAIDGTVVPAERIRWRGRRFAPAGELALYLPDWMAGVTDALDEPLAPDAVLAPGELRIRRDTSSIAPADRVPLGPEELEFVRWLEGDE